LYLPNTLDETLRNLIATDRMTAQQAARLRHQLELFFPDAFVRGFDALIPMLTCDAKDHHVLAAAIHAGAGVIVTNNLKDFPAASLTPHQIDARHPDAFLVSLYREDDTTMVRVVREQAAGLRHPSLTFEQVLDVLAQHVPRFVALVSSGCQADP